MSGRRCIAALDAGTTAVKVCLFSETADLLAVSVQEYALDARGDRVEADPDRYWQAICQGMARVLAQVPNARVEAVGLTTQGETLVPVDAAGQPLRPFLVWLDGRAGAQAEALRARLDETDFYHTTGLPGIEGALPLAKLRWLAEEEPDLFARTHKVLLLEDYLLFRLTGQMVTEPSLQTSTGWFRLDTDGYWAEGLAAAEIPADKLPELRECGSLAGPLLGEAARQLGLKAGTPVFTGAMDQTAAALAAGSGNGVVTETTGTALVAAAVTQTLRFPAGHPVTLYRHAVKGQFVYLPIGNTAADSWAAARQGVCAINPTWNHANALSGSHSDQPHQGLTPLGREFVRRMGELEVLVDVSHLSEAGFWDVMDLCQGGVIASHSNARAVCDHTRNLTDEQITAIIEHQGVIGLNFYENFVGGSRDLEAVRRHLDHILALGGDKCVALGGDWDGAELVEPLSHITRLSGLYSYLLSYGYGEELLHDVFYNNLMRVVRQS